MKAVTCILVVVGFMAVPAMADSIKVGGVLHKDVYIVTKPQYYLVHFPEEGRVEKVSRARRDVEDPMIDSDESARKGLKERFDARQAELEGALKPVPGEAVELDTEAFLKKEALVDAAVFETQFGHWIGLSVEVQEHLLQEVLAMSATKAAKRQGEQSTIQQRLGDLDAAKAEREAELGKLNAKREAAIDDAERHNAADFYLGLHERELVEYDRGNTDHVSNYWLKGADTELALEARRKEAADRAYLREAGAEEEALGQVEGAITQQERDAMAVENKGIDADRRYGAFLARMDELMLASRAGYIPGLSFKTQEAWQEDGDKRTPSVTIESPVWCLSCKREDFGISGGFAITVYDAETDAPFTRIADKDFLGMRTRIFERPGQYYFVVEQDASRIPYELTVSAVAGK